MESCPFTLRPAKEGGGSRLKCNDLKMKDLTPNPNLEKGLMTQLFRKKKVHCIAEVHFLNILFVLCQLVKGAYIGV